MPRRNGNAGAYSKPKPLKASTLRAVRKRGGAGVELPPTEGESQAAKKLSFFSTMVGGIILGQGEWAQHAYVEAFNPYEIAKRAEFNDGSSILNPMGFKAERRELAQKGYPFLDTVTLTGSDPSLELRGGEKVEVYDLAEGQDISARGLKLVVAKDHARGLTSRTLRVDGISAMVHRGTIIISDSEDRVSALTSQLLHNSNYTPYILRDHFAFPDNSLAESLNREEVVHTYYDEEEIIRL